jgi:hypothetical protein
MRILIVLAMWLSGDMLFGQGCFELDTRTCESLEGPGMFCDYKPCKLDPDSIPGFPTYICVDSLQNPVEIAGVKRVYSASVWVKIPAAPGQPGWSNWQYPNSVKCAAVIGCNCATLPPAIPAACGTSDDGEGGPVIISTTYYWNAQPVGSPNCIGAGAGGGAG